MPFMTHDKPELVQRNVLLGFRVSNADAEYEVMVRPPFDCGARQEMVAAVVVVEMTSIDGVPGADGTTYVIDAAMELPTLFVARTEIVRESPDCKLETVQDIAKLLLG